ncbi:MAG: ctaA [Geminicoccaceae bacterium]|nr:ctaA [Geminicoccaceae bacterium]
MTALRRVVGVAIALTFGLIVLGAWVRATGSGLACPDWPTCYGHWLPLPGEIPDGAGYSYVQVMLEWLHRLIAGVILGPLILLIGGLAWRVRSEQPRMPGYALAVVLLLLVQAGLGGLTVLDQNSPWSVALHLGTALLLFSVLWLIFARTAAAEPGPRVRGGLAAVTWLLALGAMVSAAMMTKSGASLACASWPLCNGALLPDLGDAAVRLNLTHRLLAAATGLASLALFLRLRAAPELRRLAGGALAAMALEIALGGLVVVLALPMWSGLLHQAFGVLTFGLLSLLMWRAVAPAPATLEDPAHVRLSRA